MIGEVKYLADNKTRLFIFATALRYNELGLVSTHYSKWRPCPARLLGIQRKKRFCNNELHGMEMHTRENENAVRELACFCYFIYDFIKRVVCLNHKANWMFSVMYPDKSFSINNRLIVNVLKVVIQVPSFVKFISIMYWCQINLVPRAHFPGFGGGEKRKAPWGRGWVSNEIRTPFTY